MAEIAVKPCVIVVKKVAVACVCPKGIVIVGSTVPTVVLDENSLITLSESGFLAGRPSASWSCT